MSVVLTTIRYLQAEGFPAEKILELVAQLEEVSERASGGSAFSGDEQAERRRAADRERKREKAESLRKVCGKSADVPTENNGFPNPSEQNRFPLKKTPLTGGQKKKVLDLALAALKAMPAVPDHAGMLHDAAGAALRDAGFEVEREFPVEVDGRQLRVDLVARLDGEMVAIELDRRRPRTGSLAKLWALDCLRVVVLRGEACAPPPNIDAVVGVPVTPRRSSSPEYPPEFQMLWDVFPKHPNASKSEALRRWEQLDPGDRDNCLTGAMRYEDFLTAERRKRPDYPGLHLATFIHQRRWEAHLEAAE
jgi:DNA-binding transcriptional MerR regulator